MRGQEQAIRFESSHLIVLVNIICLVCMLPVIKAIVSTFSKTSSELSFIVRLHKPVALRGYEGGRVP